MIKDQFVVKKPETEYNWDVCKRFETEASENLSVKISYREGHLDPNSLQMPPPLKPEDLLMPKSKPPFATKSGKNYLGSELSIDNDPDYENLLEQKATELALLISEPSSKASVVQKETVGANHSSLKKKYSVDLNRFKQKFDDYFARKDSSHHKKNRIKPSNQPSGGPSQSQNTESTIMESQAKDQSSLSNPSQGKQGERKPLPANLLTRLSQKYNPEQQIQKSKFLDISKNLYEEDDFWKKNSAIQKEFQKLNESYNILLSLKKENGSKGNNIQTLNTSYDHGSKSSLKGENKEDFLNKVKGKNGKISYKDSSSNQRLSHQNSSTHISLKSLLGQNNKLTRALSGTNDLHYSSSHKKRFSSVGREKAYQKNILSSPKEKLENSQGGKKELSLHNNESLLLQKNEHELSRNYSIKKKKSLGYGHSEESINPKDNRKSSINHINHIRNKNSFITKPNLKIEMDFDKSKTEERDIVNETDKLSSDSISNTINKYLAKMTPEKTNIKVNSPGRCSSHSRDKSLNTHNTSFNHDQSYLSSISYNNHAIYNKARKYRPSIVSRTNHTMIYEGENKKLLDDSITEGKRADNVNISRNLRTEVTPLRTKYYNKTIAKTKPEEFPMAKYFMMINHGGKRVMEMDKSFEKSRRGNSLKKVSSQDDDLYTCYAEKLKMVNQSFNGKGKDRKLRR